MPWSNVPAAVQKRSRILQVDSDMGIVVIIIKKVEVIMPNRDKKGPQGLGPQTGKGLGDCQTPDNAHSLHGISNEGRGRHYHSRRAIHRRPGPGYGYHRGRQAIPQMDKVSLETEIKDMKEQLRFMEETLEKMRQKDK